MACRIALDAIVYTLQALFNSKLHIDQRLTWKNNDNGAAFRMRQLLAGQVVGLWQHLLHENNQIP